MTLAWHVSLPAG